LFQWTLRSYELFGYSYRRMNVALNMFAMFSHAYSPPKSGLVDLSSTCDVNNVCGPNLGTGPFTINDNKLKYGSMLEFAWFKNLSLNLRFDRVEPTQMDPENHYTALTGQAV